MKKAFGSIGMALMLLSLSAPAGAAELGGVDIHGFVSQGFLYSDEYNYLSQNSTDGSFEYNEMGINFGKQLTDKLRVGIQLFSRDLGDVANNKVTLDYAYGDYHWQDWMGIRFGRVRLPLGLWNEIRDFDMLRPWIVLPQERYNELIRDAIVAVNGVGLYGNVRAGVAGNVDYYVAGGVADVDPEQGTSKYADSLFGGVLEQNGRTDSKYIVSGTLRWNTPLPGLMVGAYGAASKSTIPLYLAALDSDFEMEYKNLQKGLMAEFNWNKLSLWAEYVEEDVTTEIPGIAPEDTVEPLSYYVGAAYRFVSWFQLGAYYSEGYADEDDKDGENTVPDHKSWAKDLALTLRFDINDYWVLKIEGHKVDGTKNVLSVDNPDSDFSEKDWYYGAAKVSVSF